MTFYSIVLAILTLLPTASWSDKTPPPIPSGIVLTFDDCGVYQWVKQIPLFEKYDAKVTFFVDNFHTLKPKQIEGLLALKAAGHTIGCHGVAIARQWILSKK